MKKSLPIVIILLLVAALFWYVSSQSALDDTANETEQQSSISSVSDNTANTPAAGDANGDTPVNCQQQDETCQVAADCCSGLNLECRSVTPASGDTEKRCQPREDQVCSITCSESGEWQEPVNCSVQLVPPKTEDCANLVGACDPSVNNERNVRKCWQS